MRPIFFRPIRPFIVGVLSLVFLPLGIARAAEPDSANIITTAVEVITDQPFHSLTFGVGASTIGISIPLSYRYGWNNLCFMAGGNYQFEKDPFGQHFGYAIETSVLVGGYIQKENVIAFLFAGMNYTSGQTRGRLLFESRAWFGDGMVQHYAYESIDAVGLTAYTEVIWMIESNSGFGPFFSINSVAQRTLTMAGINMRVIL